MNHKPLYHYIYCSYTFHIYRCYNVTSSQSHTNRFDMNELEIPGLSQNTLYSDHSKSNPKLVRAIFSKQKFQFHSTNDNYRSDILSYTITLYDISNISYECIYERQIDFYSECLYSTTTATTALCVYDNDLIRSVDWSMSQHTLSRRRDLSITSIDTYVNIGLDGTLKSNKHHLMSLESCYDNYSEAGTSFRQNQWTARQILSKYSSDHTAGKKILYQQLSSTVPSDLIERVMAPAASNHSHLYTCRKHFASQLGVQFAMIILRGGYPSTNDILLSSSGHLRINNRPSYNKSTLLTHIAGLNIDESIKVQLNSLISWNETNNLKYTSSSDSGSAGQLQYIGSEKGILGQTTIKVEKDTMDIETDKKIISTTSKEINTNIIRLSKSISSYLSYPLLFGSTLMATGCTLDAISNNLDVIESELCMHYAEDLKVTMFRDFYIDECTKSLLLSAPSSSPFVCPALARSIDDSVTQTSKRVKVESAANETTTMKNNINSHESNNQSSSHQISFAIYLLAQSLAKESIIRLRSLSPSHSQPRESDPQKSASQTDDSQTQSQNEAVHSSRCLVNEWDPVWIDDSIMSLPLSSTGTATATSSDTDAPLDGALFSMIEAGLSTTMMENLELKFNSWL